MRRLDGANGDSKIIIGERMYSRQAGDRDEWKEHLIKATAYLGLSRQ
jgi:hypothetical protein